MYLENKNERKKGKIEKRREKKFNFHLSHSFFPSHSHHYYNMYNKIAKSNVIEH